MNADGNGLKKITINSFLDTSPDWSPDRSQIAFASFHINNCEILIINADGNALHNVTNHLAGDFGPAWLPALL
jgi:TolB protein